MKKFVLFLLTICFATTAIAQVSVETLESYKLLEKRTIQLYVPEDYDAEKKYPLIVVLDAEYLFDAVTANAKFYSYWNEMPQAIVVGINQNYNDARYEDCDYSDQNGLPQDKGNQFFEFIGMELIPYLEEKYSIAPFKMAVGHGLTANFINYYLFKDNPVFDAYVTLAPAFAPEMEYRIPERLQTFEKKKFYYLATGEFDNKNDKKRTLTLNGNIKGLQNEALQYYFDDFKTASQTAVASYAIPKAFNQIFNVFKPITPKQYREEILTMETPVFEFLAEKYNTIETLFGFKPQVSLNDIIAIHTAATKKEDIDSLKELGDLCKKEYPDTMMGFFFEAEHYELAGEPKKALKTYEKAFGMQEIDFITKDLALDRIDALKADFGF